MTAEVPLIDARQASVQKVSVPPIFRWPGGKRWLAPVIGEFADALEPTSYFEPFLGGGGVYLSRPWPNAVLSDANDELMRAYRGIASDPSGVAEGLEQLKVDRAVYDRLKRLKPTDDVGHAVRLLYLNRCSYGGMYRTNRNGVYNVPFSGDRTTESLWRDERLERLSEVLSTAAIDSGDFEAVVARAGRGALVYCDPVYVLPGVETAFRRYTASPFSWGDLKRLAASAYGAVARGAVVLISNTTDDRVADLFPAAARWEFDRRVTLPKAGGASLREAVYILGDRPALEIARRLP